MHEADPLTRNTLPATGSWFQRASYYLALPGAILATIWVVAGRTLFGAGGDLLPIFAISLGPVLLLILLLAAGFARGQMKLSGGSQAGFPLAVSICQAGAWLMALIFGFLVPDRISGRTVSAAATLLGQDFIGLSAGFGNTFGILTFCFAVATLICSLSALGRARRQAAGITEDDVEEAARAASSFEFLD